MLVIKNMSTVFPVDAVVAANNLNSGRSALFMANIWFKSGNDFHLLLSMNLHSKKPRIIFGVVDSRQASGTNSFEFNYDTYDEAKLRYEELTKRIINGAISIEL